MNEIITHKYKDWIIDINTFKSNMESEANWFIYHQCFKIPDNFSMIRRHGLSVKFNLEGDSRSFRCTLCKTEFPDDVKNYFTAFRVLINLIVEVL